MTMLSSRLLNAITLSQDSDCTAVITVPLLQSELQGDAKATIQQNQYKHLQHGVSLSIRDSRALNMVVKVEHGTKSIRTDATTVGTAHVHLASASTHSAR